MKETCIICTKQAHSPDLVWQDDLISVSNMVRAPEGSNNYLGYYMLETRRHIKGLYDANEAELTALGCMLGRLSRAMKSVLAAEHVYAFFIGEGVDHLHAHVVARYPGAPRSYWGPAVDEWPEAPRGTLEDIRALDAQIRAALRAERD